MKKKLFNIYDRVNGNFHLREVITGSASAFILKISGTASGYLFAIYVARYGGAEVWGSFTLAFTVMGVAAIFAGLGLNKSLLSHISRMTGQEEKISGIKKLVSGTFFYIIPSAFLITLLLFIFPSVIAEWIFNSPGLTPHIKIIALAVFPVTIIGHNSQVFRALKKIGLYVAFDFFFRFLAALVVILILALFYDSPYNAVISYTLGSYFLAVASSVILYFNITRLPAVSSGENTTGILFKTAGPLFAADLLKYLKGWVDTIIIGIFMAEADAGIYNISFRLSGAASVFLMAVNSISMPKIGQLFGADDKEGMQKTVYYSAKILYLTAFPIIIVIILASDFILGFLGVEFLAGKTIIIILCISQLIKVLSGAGGYILQVTGEEKLFMKLVTWNIVILLLLNLLFVPLWGIEGAALANLGGSFYWTISLLVSIRRRLGINIMWIPSFLLSKGKTDTFGNNKPDKPKGER